MVPVPWPALSLVVTSRRLTVRFFISNVRGGVTARSSKSTMPFETRMRSARISKVSLSAAGFFPSSAKRWMMSEMLSSFGPIRASLTTGEVMAIWCARS